MGDRPLPQYLDRTPIALQSYCYLRELEHLAITLRVGKRSQPGEPAKIPNLKWRSPSITND
ncbi:MAG: hypothetical protein F6K30_23670 [Cyanothece sp. SIO2G6]|nr:hypothetical protein [Cyanothece sp. SIO2G6]